MSSRSIFARGHEGASLHEAFKTNCNNSYMRRVADGAGYDCQPLPYHSRCII